MRLGGWIPEEHKTPDTWVKKVISSGYSAAYCPIGVDADKTLINAYAKVARCADIIIAEVGVWNNPLSQDSAERTESIKKCKDCLVLADEIGATCCVNISGSRGDIWDGPHEMNLTEETFEMVVSTVRDIIDSVNPVHTFYTLETMPWMYPDSVDSYLRLIKAIDRQHFAIHLDPVNLINCPQRYFSNIKLLKDCFAKLGVHIKSCHAKDIIMQNNLTMHLDEVRPGTGVLNYNIYLQELNKLAKDTPLMLEHLSTPEDYIIATNFIHKVAKQEGITL